MSDTLLQSLADLAEYQRETIRHLRNKIDRALLSARTLSEPSLRVDGEETRQVPTRLLNELMEELR